MEPLPGSESMLREMDIEGRGTSVAVSIMRWDELRTVVSHSERDYEVHSLV